LNTQTTPERSFCAYIVAALGSFLIVAALVWAMHRYTQPPPLGADRAATRAEALGKLRAEEADALEHAGWVDQTKGIVRLPIEEAVKMVERDWGQNPSAARSNLIARVEKATAPPPKVPEKPSQFE
jgi:uncharacterized protein YdaU (DUF1376 family)